MYYAKKYGLLPADRIVVPIFQTGLTKHHAIYLSADEYNVEWIAKTKSLRGVELSKQANILRLINPIELYLLKETIMVEKLQLKEH